MKFRKVKAARPVCGVVLTSLMRTILGQTLFPMLNVSLVTIVAITAVTQLCGHERLPCVVLFIMILRVPHSCPLIEGLAFLCFCPTTDQNVSAIMTKLPDLKSFARCLAVCYCCAPRDCGDAQEQTRHSSRAGQPSSRISRSKRHVSVTRTFRFVALRFVSRYESRSFGRT